MLIRFIHSVAIIAALALAGVTSAQAQTRTVPVLELFTSQGCSSCPPADRLFERYALRDDVVALTLPVDYWDYLGWKDTLANSENSMRQRLYAKARGDGAVYTPQVVVNGVAHVIGSKQSEIDQSISATRSTGIDVEIGVKKVGDQLEISVPQNEIDLGSSSVTVWFASVQGQADVKVKRGENRGRALSYYNVVRNLSAVGMWTGQPQTFRVPLHSVQHADATKCAVILQKGVGGPIIAAAWYKH
ncbi:MAG: DUF1223 domain-containing protein [Pseudomonadota bacterium]